MNTQVANLSQFTQTPDWMMSYDYMPLRTILAKDLFLKNRSTLSAAGQIEISRRVSISLAAFTFTLINGRRHANRSKKGILLAIFLSSLYLVCFISTKSLKHYPHLSTLVFLIPHPIIALFCLKSLEIDQGGVE